MATQQDAVLGQYFPRSGVACAALARLPEACAVYESCVYGTGQPLAQAGADATLPCCEPPHRPETERSTLTDVS
jgi:hypothetical protein